MDKETGEIGDIADTATGLKADIKRLEQSDVLDKRKCQISERGLEKGLRIGYANLPSCRKWNR